MNQRQTTSQFAPLARPIQAAHPEFRKFLTGLSARATNKFGRFHDNPTDAAQSAKRAMQIILFPIKM